MSNSRWTPKAPQLRTLEVSPPKYNRGGKPLGAEIALHCVADLKLCWEIVRERTGIDLVPFADAMAARYGRNGIRQRGGAVLKSEASGLYMEDDYGHNSSGDVDDTPRQKIYRYNASSFAKTIAQVGVAGANPWSSIEALCKGAVINIWGTPDHAVVPYPSLEYYGLDYATSKIKLFLPPADLEGFAGLTEAANSVDMAVFIYCTLAITMFKKHGGGGAGFTGKLELGGQAMTARAMGQSNGKDAFTYYSLSKQAPCTVTLTVADARVRPAMCYNGGNESDADRLRHALESFVVGSGGEPYVDVLEGHQYWFADSAPIEDVIKVLQFGDLGSRAAAMELLTVTEMADAKFSSTYLAEAARDSARVAQDKARAKSEKEARISEAARKKQSGAAAQPAGPADEEAARAAAARTLAALAQKKKARTQATV